MVLLFPSRAHPGADWTGLTAARVHPHHPQMAAKTPGYNSVIIDVDFASGQAPDVHPRVSILDRSMHRVINPNSGNRANFHGLPPGKAEVVVHVDNVPVARQVVEIR